MRGRELENRLGELLHFVGLDAHANNYVGTFSGGMKRRLNFAAALVHKPKLVMLDEPTAGVDPHSRQRIFEMVRTLRDDGHAIVYITHYMEEAEGLCDRIGIMNGGRIIAMGSLDDLLADMGCTEIIELRGLDGSADLRAVRGARGLCSIEVADDLVRLYVNNAAAFLAPLQKIISRSESPVRMKIAPISLEDLFLNLTGMELRD